MLAAVLVIPLLWEAAATLGRTPRSWPLMACSAGIAAAVTLGGWSARKLLPAGLVAAALLLVSAALPVLGGGTAPTTPPGASPQTPVFGYADDYPRLVNLPIAQLTAVLALVVLLCKSAPARQVAAGIGALTVAATSAGALDWATAHRAHAGTAIAPATLWGYGVLALGTAIAIGLYARQPSAASYSVASR